MKYLLAILFGTLLSLTSYSQSDTTFYSTGEVESIYTVVGIDKDMIDFKSYYKNGQIKSSGLFNPYGQKCGVWYSWWEDGKTCSRMAFHQDKKVGEWYLYDNDGRLTMWAKFRNGKVKKSISYHEDDGILLSGM